MSNRFARRALLVLLWSLWAGEATAQETAVLGTRARGMGGAFVAVADDAAAVYWNPAGLAGGAYFSLLLDGSRAETLPPGDAAGGREGSWLLALTTPALGISYYRLRRDVATVLPGPPLGLSPDESAALGLDPAGPLTRRETLVTHHIGVTLVQSLTDSLAVGATLKGVRGTAASALLLAGDRELALDEFDPIGRTETRVDADLGVMARGALGSIGLVVRNLTAPSFRTAESAELVLERQVRAGVSVALLPNWRLASDVDLTRQRGVYGDVREVALGTEAQVTRRVAARAGVRLNTAGPRGRTPALSLGGSYALTGAVFLDAQATAGADEALRGWGLAGRVLF